MGIKAINVSSTGQIGIDPRRVTIITTDNLATVTAAGYLNLNNLLGYTIYPTDVIEMWYGFVNSSNPGIFSIFTAVVANGGQITLSLWDNPGNVLLPVVNGDVAIFNGTGGQIKDSNILGTNLVVKNAVNTMAAASGIVLAKVNGTEAANAVTANGVAGVITTSALTTGALSSYAITWTNSFITSTSNVSFTLMGGTNTNKSVIFQIVPGSGTATLTIYNIAASGALNGTVLIGYTVL